MSNKQKVSFLVLAIVFVFLTTGLQAQYYYGSWDYGNYSKHNTTHMAMYNFNEGIGTTTHDDSGRNKTGFLYGTSWAPEKDNNLPQNAALYFDGGDFVKVANNADFNISSANVNGFTISAMIKVSLGCVKPYLMICSKYQYISESAANGFTFYITNGQLRFTAYNGTNRADIQDVNGHELRDGRWHFVAVEYLDGVYTLYIDPTETDIGQSCSINSFVQPANNTNDFFIGRRDVSWDYDKDFVGTIDCLYLYEIEPTSVLNPPNRMWGFNNEGYWSFDEGSSTSEGIVNDLVRWTSYTAGYHNYGKICGTGFYFLDRLNAWKGEHAAEFNNAVQIPNTYVQVTDPTNRLDFAANPGAENLYIEFLLWPNNNSILQYTPLIEKYDYNPDNGYRIYFTKISNDSLGYLSFEVANNGSTGRLTSQNIYFNGWIHVWAWAQAGVLHLMLTDDTHGICFPEVTQPINCGIGATTSPLYFGSSLINNYRRYYDGWMDEIVIGRCFPGLEHWAR